MPLTGDLPTVGAFKTLREDALLSAPTDIDSLRVNNGLVEIFWREQTHSVASRMVEADQAGAARRELHLLLGPGGCGKSIMLYTLAQFAKLRGWIVFYIANGAELASLADNHLARFLLEHLKAANPHWPSNYESLDYADPITGLDLPVDILKEKARQALGYVRDPRHVSLFAVDQWNVIRDPTTSPFFKELFGTFQVCRVSRGATLLAASSSFSAPDPQPGEPAIFVDADAIRRPLYVRLYSDIEFDAIVERMRDHGRLPSVAQGLDNATLTQNCGRVGRMIAFAQHAWERAPAACWGREHLGILLNLAAEYYRRRVRSLLMHTATSTTNDQDRRTLCDFVARIFLNKQTPTELADVSCIPEAFQWAGLYDLDRVPFRPLCPSVIVGINQALCDPTTSVLEIMANHPHTRGTALELFVERAFRVVSARRGPAIITLHTTDIHGDAPEDWDLVVSNVRVQDRDDPAAALANLTNGTLVICYLNHSVVDMVLYCNQSVYFLQISMLPYLQHATKIDNLLNCNVRGTSTRVGVFYTDAARRLWPTFPRWNARFTEAVRQHVKYVYITPDTTRHAMRDRAKYVRRAGLNSFGQDANIFDSLYADGP